MSQDTLNIIIGALIGFIPSASLAICVHLLSQREKNKERERKVIESRINQVETAVYEVIKLINLIERNLSRIYNFTEGEKDRDVVLNKLTLSTKYLTTLTAKSYLLKDEQLEMLVSTFLKDIDNFVTPLYKTDFLDLDEERSIESLESIQKRERQMINSVEAFFSFSTGSLVSKYPQILDRLDYIRKKL